MTLATLDSEARARPAQRGYTRAQALPALLRRRIVLLDGAMGTMLQQRRLSEAQFRGERFALHPGTLKGNNELLNLTQPQVVREIHEAYLAAGSDIVETNTFGATSVAQADYGLAHLAREMNVRAAALAREACDRFGTLERRPDQVSGGELQRIALARILLLRPALVFADEPTSRLDPINQKLTIELLVSVLAERCGALLLVTHDPVLARKVSDRSFVIGTPRLEADGCPLE